MSDDSDDEGRRRDKFVSERTDRKRSYDDDRQYGGMQDTPRPRGGRHDGFPKRSRYDNRPPYRMGGPPPQQFRPLPPGMGSFPPAPGGMPGPRRPPFGGPRAPGAPLMMHPATALPLGPGKPSRKPLQFDVMDLEEWRATKGKGFSGDQIQQEYSKFKTSSIRRQMQAIFDAHKEKVWFKDLYHPSFYDAKQERLKTSKNTRLDIFMKLLNDGRLDKLSWRSESRKPLELLLKDINRLLDTSPVEDQSEPIAKDTTSSDIVPSEHEPAEDASENTGELDYDDEKDDDPDTTDPRRVKSSSSLSSRPANKGGRSFSVQIFPTANVSRVDMETELSKVKGFRRLGVASNIEASLILLKPDERKVWATFGGVEVKDVMKDLGSLLLDNQPLSFQIATRSLELIRSPEACILVASDRELAEKIIDVLDKCHSLYPSASGIEANPVLEDKLSLEKMVLYLRIVHSYDFFSGSFVEHEDGLAQRVGFLTVPNVKPFLGTPTDGWRDNGWAIADSGEEFKDFPGGTGKFTDETAINFLAECNTEKLGDSLYLCPLSGKKFRAPEFVRKHIVLKHKELVTKATRDLDYFNAYVDDIFRTRSLPLSIQRPQQGGMLPSPGNGAPLMRGPGMPGMEHQRDPNKDEFGRDIPVNRRDGRPPRPQSFPSLGPAGMSRNRPTYGDLF